MFKYRYYIVVFLVLLIGFISFKPKRIQKPIQEAEANEVKTQNPQQLGKTKASGQSADTIDAIEDGAEVMEGEVSTNKAQPICNYAINEYNKFYHVEIVKTEPYTICKNLTVELYKYGQDKQVFFNFDQNLGCASSRLSNRSSVVITLENKDSVTFYHFWYNDCGKFKLRGKLSNEDIKRLQTTPIKSIRLEGTKRSFEIKDLDYELFFIHKLKCLD